MRRTLFDILLTLFTIATVVGLVAFFVFEILYGMGAIG